MRITCFCTDENLDSYPAYGEVTLTRELVKRIIELKKAVNSVKANIISEYESTLDFIGEDGNDEEDNKEWKMECQMLNIDDTGAASWSGDLKHTSILVFTEEIPFNTIEEVNKVYQTPREELPLLIGHELEAVRETAERRLKDETI